MTDQKKLKVIEEAFNYYHDRNSLTSKDEKELLNLVNELYEAISVTRCSTQLLCVNKGDDNGITKGYEYKCIDRNKTHYRIVDNYSYEGWFAKEHFKEIT